MIRSPPWQYEWKRPEWQSPTITANDDKNGEADFAVDGIPVASSSSLVSVAEIYQWENIPQTAKEEEDGTFLVLTATLYSTDKSTTTTTTTTKSSSADVLLLELVQHKRHVAKRLMHRMLRWPGSTITMTEEESMEETKKTSWWPMKKKTKQPKVGLVQVTLCRRPVGQDLDPSVDAMDVVALLSLGLDANESQHTVSERSSSALPEMTTESSQQTDNDDDESTADLIMACFTTDGRVLLYSPDNILRIDDEVNKESQDLENGLASLLLGNAIHEQLERSVLPLCQPLTVVPLSVPLKRAATKSASQKHGDSLEAIPENLALLKEEVYEEEEDAADEKQNLWEGSFWDANVEASTAKYHTVDNVPTLLIPAFDFIAVAGRGTRIRRIKRRKKAMSRSRGSSVSSWETASQQDEEKWEMSAKTRSNFADSPDPTNKETWWEESQIKAPPADDDEESNQTRKREERNKTQWIEYKEPGGFVTFISLRYNAESRTVYLPFAPKQLSAVVWGGMQFVIVLGDESLAPIHAPLAVAIRVDSFDMRSIPRGEAPSFSLNDPDNVDKSKTSPVDKKKTKKKAMCSVRRFHLIPILLPSKGSTSSEVVTAVAVSSTLTDPPAIVLQYSSEPEMSGDLLATLHSLRSLDVVPTILTHQATGGYRRFGKQSERALAIRTHLHHGHAARIPHTVEPSTTRNTWCRAGQGWSLFGVDDEVFFVCWEGATANEGAFVTKIHSEEEFESKVDALTTLRLFAPVVSVILPLSRPVKHSAGYNQFGPGIKDDSRRSSNLHLPFTSPYTMPSFVRKRDLPAIDDDDDDDVEDIVQDALDSLANENLSSQLTGQQVSPLKRQSLSYRERSVRLVRRCSSWTLLGDTEEKNSYYDSQVPVMVIQLGPLLREHFILSLREVVVDNATASPFNQVLGWLSQSNDYYTAASVALDLLRDVDCLRDLRRSKEEGAEDNKRAKLEGLLDGIVPLYDERDSSDRSSPSPSHSVRTQLADMSVGCLLKGGLSMSSTLETFVQNNPNYDPGRACLMLVSTTVCTLSRDPTTIKSVMGTDYEWPADDEVAISDIVWPLRTLFRVGVSRDYLATILQLLNAAIPDDLRNRGHDGASTLSPFSLQICKSIVSLIVASSAADLMLDLKDETTGKRYWASLDHNTRLDLALISLDGTFPLLRQAEVRSWALGEMDKWIQTNGSLEAPNDCDLPDEWLKTLCKACLVNAGCDLECVAYDASVGQESEQTGEDVDDDGTRKHFETNRLAIEALSPSPGSGGLDFDLFIPALLLLANRNVPWYDDACLSTQNMLDAACYLAGRHRKEEPAFSFDGPVVMKQCARSGNISAGANLIGGKNGLVLQCCAILINGAGTSMDDAEDYILNDELAETTLWTKAKHDKKKIASGQSPFELTDEHRSVLWLLEEYVLSIKTYGDFDTAHVRGKVDPVFAARACFRTWFMLSVKEITQATAWLVEWLRRRLGIERDQVSPKRLACSALTCALMWPATDGVVDAGELDETANETLLAHVLDMESLFLVELSQSCCGLVEAVPPSFALEILRQIEEAEAKETRPSFQVDV